MKHLLTVKNVVLALCVLTCLSCSENDDNKNNEPNTCGEGFDRTTLTPPGVQSELIKLIHSTGKPIVLITVHGRPYSIKWEKEHIPAIIEVWYPGEEGGTAVANILLSRQSRT